jgi:hypothetical protein
MDTYTIGIKKIDDTIHVTTKGLDLADAEARMEYAYNRVMVQENWAGIVVIHEESGEIHSEMEW